MAKVFETLDWLLKFLLAPLRKNFSATVLTPPFMKTQIALVHKGRIIVKIKSRGKADRTTFSQIFSREDYSLALINRQEEMNACYQAILFAGKTPLVLDVGANIGLASVYLKISFPACGIVAVEPEQKNFEFLQMLASKYGFHPTRAGLAAQKGSLKIVDPGLGENGFRTEELGGVDSSSKIDGIPLDELAEVGEGLIPFILKIDIEGAEKFAFQNESESLSRFKLITIEPHDWLIPGSAGMLPFLQQISKLNFDLVIRGENLFFVNNSWSFEGKLD